jgi:hypothetical protein
MLINVQDINKDTREKALKRLLELSLKTIGEIPQLDELNEEQEEWTKEKRFHK